MCEIDEKKKPFLAFTIGFLWHKLVLSIWIKPDKSLDFCVATLLKALPMAFGSNLATFCFRNT